MSASQPRHAARESIAHWVALPVGVLFTAAASLATLFGIVALPPIVMPAPVAAMTLPSVDVEASVAADPCTDSSVVTALADGDEAAIIAGFGGAGEFREAVIAGNAPCISLSDPQRSWVVVNKQRPLQPSTFAPAALADISLRSTTASDDLRPEASAALKRMADEARAAGVGTLGVNNGYRSFGVQQRTYGSHVSDKGRDGADAVSARPGFSEHQTGLAFDLIACSSGCGNLDQFGSSPQGQWVAANAWKYGFVVRYEHGKTDTTGYLPEPWHIRYIGVDLATAYHEGGFHSLEEFFGLPDAPDYAH